MPPAAKLRDILKSVPPRLRKIGEGESLDTHGTGRWSKREILGHLIDSAANNHQRFVRAQMHESLAFPGYEQSRWVEAQGYRDRDWSELVEIWTNLNLHLAHTIERIPEVKLNTLCTIGDGNAVTLEFIVNDYLRHLTHHLDQILTPENAEGKKHPPFG